MVQLLLKYKEIAYIAPVKIFLRLNVLSSIGDYWPAVVRHFTRLLFQGVGLALAGGLSLLFVLGVQIGACAIFSQAKDIQFLSERSREVPEAIVLQAHPIMQVAPWGQSFEENRLLLGDALYPALNPARR